MLDPSPSPPSRHEPSPAHRKLQKALSRGVTSFDMLQDGDRVMVAVSGGKDSYAMLHLLRELAKKAPVRFELVAVNVDQGHPGYPAQTLVDWMAREGYDFRLVNENTYAIVTEKIPEGKTYCSLCSRLRRGILYRVAKELGCNKIALGHHRNDILQTFLLNLYFAGKLAAMPPKLVADEGRLQVIRPLVYAAEDIRTFAEEQAFPILPCNLCGSQDNMQRKIVGKMLDDLEAERPGTKAVMLAALSNVRPSQLVDKGLWQKLGLAVSPPHEDEEGPSALIPLSRLEAE